MNVNPYVFLLFLIYTGVLLIQLYFVRKTSRDLQEVLETKTELLNENYDLQREICQLRKRAYIIPNPESSSPR